MKEVILICAAIIICWSGLEVLTTTVYSYETGDVVEATQVTIMHSPDAYKALWKVYGTPNYHKTVKAYAEAGEGVKSRFDSFS